MAFRGRERFAVWPLCSDGRAGLRLPLRAGQRAAAEELRAFWRPLNGDAPISVPTRGS